MQPLELEIDVIVSAPFQENTYLAHISGRDDCLVFDPGLEPDEILAWLERKKLRPAAIMITHGHSDHIAGNGVLKEQFPDCPIVASHGDAPMLTNPRLNLSAEFGLALYSPPAEVLVAEGDVYSAAGIDLLVREIPGHSSGHVVFICRETRPITVFGGDVLFAGSIGRTDLPGAASTIWPPISTRSCSPCPTTPESCRPRPNHDRGAGEAHESVRRRPSGVSRVGSLSKGSNLDSADAAVAGPGDALDGARRRVIQHGGRRAKMYARRLGCSTSAYGSRSAISSISNPAATR